MHAYETLFILKPDLEAEKMEAAIEKFKTLIVNDGGTIVSVEKWGKRRLAYIINDYQEGYYVLINFNANPGAALELERVQKIADEVIRFITIRKDE